MRIVSRMRGFAIVSAVVATAAAGATASASADRPLAGTDEKNPIVEDYAYPGADRILAESGIQLYKGDGNIMLAECPANAEGRELLADGLVRIRRNNPDGSKPVFCLKITVGQPGLLSMKIPEVTFIKGDGHTLTATIAEQAAPIAVAKNEWTPIPGDKGSTVVTLTASP